MHELIASSYSCSRDLQQWVTFNNESYYERLQPCSTKVMLDQTHVNRWDCVLASQNGNSFDDIVPTNVMVFQLELPPILNYSQKKKS